MNEKELAVTSEKLHSMTLHETLTLGETLAKSGYFSDVKQAAQAVVKILAGRELGFDAIASMTGIHIIQNKVSVGANLLASAVKRDPRYDYRVVKLDDNVCEVAFFENGKEVGRSIFTIKDAQQAGLTTKPTWQQFPRNMLFARAISNGIRWYCPDVTGGAPAYTPEELGAEVDADGEIIDLTPTVIEQTPQPHWIEDERVRKRFWAWTNDLALTDAQVHEALDVEHVKDYQGTMADAKDQILGWIDEHALQSEAQREAEAEPA